MAEGTRRAAGPLNVRSPAGAHQLILPMTHVDRITNLVSREYANCPPGTASAFCRLFVLIQTITALPDAPVYAAMRKMFPLETEDFEREAEPVNPIYLGPFARQQRPGSNAEWN
jgi:hypothetical protein